MGKFNLMDYMSDVSTAVLEAPEQIEQVSIFDIEPNEDNFYSMSGMEHLKDSIVALGGVQQNLVLVRLPKGSRYKYKALAGHRRRLACEELVKEGYEEYEQVPALIKGDMDDVSEDAILVMTNSTQRELTDYEKVMQHMKLKKILPKIKKRHQLDGRIRELEADYLNVLLFVTLPGSNYLKIRQIK